jgi:hypothetical protein
MIEAQEEAEGKPYVEAAMAASAASENLSERPAYQSE